MFKKIQTFLSGPAGYIVLLLGAAGAAATIQVSPATEEREAASLAPKIYTVIPERIEDLTLPTRGQIKLTQETRIKAAIDAELVHLNVRSGQRVKAGQRLALLNNREAVAAVLRARSEITRLEEESRHIEEEAENAQMVHEQLNQQLRLQRKQVQRAKSLHKRRLASAAKVDEQVQLLLSHELEVTRQRQVLNTLNSQKNQLEEQQNKAQADLIDAEQLVRRTEIKAPADGEIQTVSVAIGEFVQAGSELLVLLADDDAELVVALPERWLALIRKLQREQLEEVALVKGGQAFKLKRLSRSLSPETGQHQAFFELPESFDYSIGQVINVELHIPADPHWLRLPRTVLQPGSRLYVVSEERLLQSYPQFFLAGAWIILTAPDLLKEYRWLDGYLPGAFNGQKVIALEGKDV